MQNPNVIKIRRLYLSPTLAILLPILRERCVPFLNFIGYNVAMEKNRSIAQDIGKGLMIIGVIFFHSYVMTFENHSESLQNFNILFAFFPYILCVFFFYSGYNYKPNNLSYLQNVAKRAKQLLIPMVFAFLLSAILISSMELAFHYNEAGPTLHAIGNSLLYALMSEPTAMLIGFPQEGGFIFELVLSLGLLWFVVALFFSSLLFFFLVKYTNKSVSSLISILALLLIAAFCMGEFIGPYLPYAVESYPIVVALMLVASYLKQRNFLDRPMDGKRNVAILIINALIAEGLVIATGIFLHYKVGSMTAGTMPGGMFDPALLGFDAFVSFAFGVLGVYFIHTVSRFIELIPVVSKGLAWVGKRSALFYLFHPIFLDLAAIAIFQKKAPLGQAQGFIYTFVVLLAMILVFLLIEFLMKKFGHKKETALETKGNPDK